MSQNPDLSRHSDYFAARAIDERRMAMASADPHVRAIHLEMAERYDAFARGEDTTKPRLVVADDQQRVG